MILPTPSAPSARLTLTIRDLPDWMRKALRARASHQGHSIEEEAREILRGVLRPTEPVVEESAS